MEPKKNKKYELESKRPLFFGIGMIISLSLTLVAFEWKSPIDPINLFEQGGEYIDEYLPPVTINTPPPPPPPKAVQIVEVDNNDPEPPELPDIDVNASQDEPIPDIIIEEPPIDEVEEAPENWAEVMPSFEGGIEKFYTFVSKNIKYPNQAKRMGVEGKVFIQFVVEKDGTLSNIQSIKGIGAGCEEEAIRVMKLIPKFKPGKQGDRRVRVQMVVPIHFVLN